MIGESASTDSVVSANISDLASKLVVGYKFYVFIDVVELAFNKVSAIEKYYDYQTVQQGGANDELFFLRKPLEQPSKLVFEDGGMTTSVVNMKLCFNDEPKEILVLLCSADGTVRDVITIKNAVVSKVSLGSLDAERSELVVNSIEVMHSGFSRAPFAP